MREGERREGERREGEERGRRGREGRERGGRGERERKLGESKRGKLQVHFKAGIALGRAKLEVVQVWFCVL